mgnify:CR=1 FL=1
MKEMPVKIATTLAAFFMLKPTDQPKVNPHVIWVGIPFSNQLLASVCRLPKKPSSCLLGSMEEEEVTDDTTSLAFSDTCFRMSSTEFPSQQSVEGAVERASEVEKEKTA